VIIVQDIRCIEDQGYAVKEVKVLGDSLKNAGVFVVYNG
jgi:hypothetical protein